MSTKRLFDPENQKSSCFTGFVAHEDGRVCRENVELSFVALENTQDRTFVDADGKTSDGTGISLLQYTKDLFKEDYESLKGSLSGRDLAVGNVFLPQNDELRIKCEKTLEKELKNLGYEDVLWKDAEIDESVLGETAKASLPKIREIFVPGVNSKKFRDDLIIARRKAEKVAEKFMGGKEETFYVCSLSPNSLVFKGLTTSKNLPIFYKRLQDKRLGAAAVIMHGRAATNVLPKWELAQPFRDSSFNGEFNTIRGNRKNANLHANRYAHLVRDGHAKDLFPIITPGKSDSASADEIGEYYKLAGFAGPTRKVMMIPDANRDDVDMTDEYRQTLNYLDVFQEDLGGPAAWVMSCDAYDDIEYQDIEDDPNKFQINPKGYFNGVLISANLSNERPVREDIAEYINEKGEKVRVICVSSQSGAANDPHAQNPAFAEENMISHGNLNAGKMVGVAFAKNGKPGRIVRDKEFKEMVVDQLVDSHLAKNITPLKTPKAKAEDYDILKIKDPKDREKEITAQHRMAGYTRHAIWHNILVLAKTSSDPLSSMGDDRPKQGISLVQRNESEIFNQSFNQVSASTIDSEREHGSMSTKTYFGSFYGPNGEKTNQKVVSADHSYLTAGAYNALEKEYLGQENIQLVDATFDLDLKGEDLEESLDRIAQETVDAFKTGKHVTLHDRNGGTDEKVRQMILFATAAASAALVKEGLYGTKSLNVLTAKGYESHFFAMLMANGATSAHFYLAEETLAYEHARGIAFKPFTNLDGSAQETEPSFSEVIDHNVGALVKGLMSTQGKAGSPDLGSFRNANFISVEDTSEEVINKLYPGVGLKSPLGGLGFKEFSKRERYFHQRNMKRRKNLVLPTGSGRAMKGSEAHDHTQFSIGYLIKACRTGDIQYYEKYKEAIENNLKDNPIKKRDLLDFNFEGCTPIPLENVEPAEDIVKRIVIGGMSHGSLSPETKAALTLAARTLGIRINSGEGGIPQNWRGTILQETDFQSASGRFGNTTDNMVAVEPNRYIQKKYAQGAKPGKGGHLPGKKVNPFIAKNRGVVPGTGLISSSQNHSGYSVEDETTEHRRYKEVNPYARTSGKLASKEGIGNIAVGLAKATVDDIVVCGWDGGTGAAKKPDMKNTGLDLEPGLAETNQALTENRFRTKKSITAASGIRPIGWDAAKLHILGADYLEIGLAALQSLGCLVLKLCHTNTCKVGIATQDPKLRTRFEGDAQHVINLLMFWANDIRPILAKLGREKIDDIIGHTNLLKMSDKKYLVPWSNYGEPGKSPYVSFSELGFDFEALLAPPDPNGGPPQHCELQSGERAEYENPDNPDRAISIDRAYLEKNAEKYKKHMSCWQPGDAPLIITTKAYTFNHDIGIRLSGVNARQFNDKVSGPEMPVHIMSKGQTGQSTGAYGKGVRIEHEGVLNDYVGLSSTNCEIIAYPIKNSPIHFNTQNNVILGNVCYYGANGGKLRAAGGTGNRFALSNLGGNFVVEFVQDNGCNLMAAGKGLILGEVGPDFAAGYTGGDIVVFDKAGTLHKRVHKKSVELIPVRFGTLAEQWALESLKDHVKETGSLYAQGLLREWAQIINSGKMVNVRPKTKPYYDPDWENQPEIIEFLQTQQKLIMRPFI